MLSILLSYIGDLILALLCGSSDLAIFAWTESRSTREEVAAADHIPPAAMIGIVESQGYGSLREQHRALYQAMLGPDVALLEGEIQQKD